ncbi:MAG: hypothetical protein Kow009_05940 [Spirochaetales bacterium]
MKKTPDIETLYRELAEKVSQLPDHTQEEIESAAHHLEMLHYQNMLESADKDFLRYRKEDILNRLKKIATADPSTLKASRTAVEEWDNPEISPEENRVRRMQLIYREYRKLCALRSNKPEAWDEINELYYDD